ncbi:MAG: NTP transferase domain-containing protein [Anaerolineae bacterium]|jgi:bifunctional UDP-N-acetylglucosamine pyrophosphorylase/glucosamine-1-phosphate N-acetyltransferase|nr:hypothetical protein [Chloroflexota bacterium]MCO6442989.1 NTP transferase domain-containing protein [Anaerolineae bacterium]MDL1916634.1 hypothetical protein [Anaerolineae bacterium CFX4]OQY79912.1 MAG: hypothetical protein B6D42_14010 [Anaerolineae bacterium UTCFX5]GIK29590.1 MAG: glucose-1-phosphate thymidylyltransferase [Chloroflexota bacterium]
MQKPYLIVLAGGASSRMWPLREKSLIRFGEHPLLIYQLQRYSALGFSDVVIVGNPENTQIIQDMTSRVTGLQVQVITQPEPKGMGDALLRAGEVLPLAEHPAVYVTQVHDLTDSALHLEMLDRYRADPSRSYLAGVEREDYFPGGYLIVNADGRITGIVEKPGAENRPSNLVNIVAHIHSDATRLIDAIKTEYARAVTPDDHYERAMDRLMADHPYHVVRYSGQWTALKFPWHVLDVMNFFLGQIDGQNVHPSAFVAKTASLIGNVYIGPDVRIFPGAAVVGPAYVGAGSIVGNNALVRNSMVLNHVDVGFTTEVARSYVADNCALHACRVLDSIFAPGVNFSAGCTTANLRMDRGPVPTVVKGARVDTGLPKLGAIVGQNAFLSVDVMTMPGVKVGEGAQVGPGTHVFHDVPDRTRVYVKQDVQTVSLD